MEVRKNSKDNFFINLCKIIRHVLDNAVYELELIKILLGNDHLVDLWFFEPKSEGR